MPRLNSLLAGGAIAATLCVTACSGSDQTPTMPGSGAPAASTAPVPSPTPSPTGSGNATGSATISGSLISMTSSAAPIRPAATVTLTVTITGTGISSTVAPGGTFTLNGVPAGNIELHFGGAGVDDRTTIADVADNEQIHIDVTVTGARAIVNVTDRKKPANGVELEGLIASINLGGRTLVVNGTTVSVPATATIRHGDTTFSLADLRVGQRVHVTGTTSGSTIVASEVKLQDENPKPPDDDEAEAEGTVSGLGGTCPALTFTVHSTRVSTNASTQFLKGTCGQLKNGTKVEVEGARLSDGSITAAKVTGEK